MSLSHDIISQFAKVVNKDKKQNVETTVYGTIETDDNGNKYVRLDGSDKSDESTLIPLTDSDRTSMVMSATAEKGDRVTVLLKDHTAVVTGNLTYPAVNEQKMSRIEIAILERVDNAERDAADAVKAAEDAAKTSTNFLSLDNENGLQLGNKTSGSWSGFRAQISSAAFNVLNAAGTVIASYGAKLIELGKNATDAIIKFCGGKGQIEYDADDDYLQLSADNVRLKGVEIASLYSNYTDSNGIFRNGAVHASPGQVQITAGGGSDNSNIHVNPTNIQMATENYYLSGIINDSDNGGTYVSVTKGNSGIWTYKKYSNGDVELWGTYYIEDEACTTALGNMYRTLVIEPDAFPFTVYSPNLTAAYETNGYGAMLWATTNTTNYYPPNYYLIRPVSGTIGYGQINFHVFGKWKQ